MVPVGSIVDVLQFSSRKLHPDIVGGHQTVWRQVSVLRVNLKTLDTTPNKIIFRFRKLGGRGHRNLQWSSGGSYDFARSNRGLCSWFSEYQLEEALGWCSHCHRSSRLLHSTLRHEHHRRDMGGLYRQVRTCRDLVKTWYRTRYWFLL